MPRTTSSSTFQELTDQLSTDELVKRLKNCCKNLRECESADDANSSSLHALTSSLIQPFLRNHRSREVKGLVACCIADLFRVYYPNPPYDYNERKEVFNLFLNQLQGLEKPSSPAFLNSFQLLETLASTRLFTLSIEMDDQDILTDVFKKLFSVVNSEQSTRVKNYIIDILSALVQDGDSLPQEVMDVIFSNILEPVKTENKVTYAFTVDFIRKTSSHIEPYIHLYFNNALVVGKSAESEVSDHLYDLILELHAIDSSVLLAVMPQLEFKLKSTDTEERSEATKLLAKMFSQKSSKLATLNRPLWNCFLGRFSDVSPHIRVECVRYSKHFLIHHPHLAEDVTSKLHDRFYDKEERVRLEVVKSVCEAAADNYEIMPKILLDDLEGRMRDKVWSVRKESISNMARIYRQLMSSSFSSGGTLNSTSLKTLHWIPTKILHCYYRDSTEDKLTVERCLLSCIVPVNLANAERMERMIHVYNSLSDDHAVRAFDALLISRHRIRGCLRELIQVQQNAELKGDTKKQILLAHVTQLARYLPDSLKSQAYLDYLVNSLVDDSLRNSLLKSIDTSCTCAEVLTAKVEVVSKVGSKTGLLDTVRNLLDRACPMLIDANCIKILVIKVCSELCLDISKEAEEEGFLRAKKAIQLIKVLAGTIPANFGCSEVFESLITLLRHDDKEIVKSILQVLTQTGAHIDQNVAGAVQPILTQLALKGEPELSKDTVKCINSVFREPKPIMERLYSSLVSHLDYNDDNLKTVLISLGQIAKLQPQVFATKYKAIIKVFIVKKLMIVDRAEDEFVEGNAEWAEDEDISYETKVKVLGIKLLVNWLLGSTGADEKGSNAVIRLLNMTLTHDGDLQDQGNISAHDRSRLRLAAACGLLKLAKSSVHRDFITLPILQKLALTAQDTCEKVREKFMVKLNKGLLSLQLPLGYLSIMVYAGIEPDKARRDRFRKMISNNVTKRRQYLSQHSKAKENPHVIMPEYAVSYVVYLVAHHPQFSRTNPQRLDVFKDCLWFFLEPIVIRGENYGFLGKLLDTIKLTVDAQDPMNSETNKNLYAASDLAIGVMASKLTHIKLGNFEGDVVLPSKLYQSKGKGLQPNEIRYLPPEYNCTPTKRLKVEPLIAPNSTTAEAGVAPLKRAKPLLVPPAKASNKKSSGVSSAKQTKKRTDQSSKQESKANTTDSPAKGTTKSKARGQTATRKTTAKKQIAPSTRRSTRIRVVRKEVEEMEEEEEEEIVEEMNKMEEDSVVSDMEDDRDDEVVESVTTPPPAKGKKRLRTKEVTTRRSVRRKVLQNGTESQRVQEDESDKVPAGEELPDRKKQKLKEAEESEENTPPPAPEPATTTTGIRRKTRHRR